MSESQPEIDKIEQWGEDHPEILLCIVFGSLAEGNSSFSSDLDIAIACKKPIDADGKQSMVEELGLALGRPIDLIDLNKTKGTLLHQILTKGELVFCRDHQLYAEIIKKMLFNQADMMPYYYRSLKEKREKWINE